MATAKHTPGPWEWDSNVCDYDPEQDAPWLVSTETAKYPDCAILQGQIKCYSEANARLIAAAPELLAACQAIVEYQRLAESDETYGLLSAYAKAFEASIAAVAKATGEPA